MGNEKSIYEGMSMKTKWGVVKFRDPTGEIEQMLRNGAKIEDVIEKFKDKYIGTKEFEGNIGLREGREELIDIICGLGAPTKWDAIHAYLGVGDSTTAPDDTQTGLQAVVNKSWKPMDSGYPQRNGRYGIWRATWGAVDGNYAWQEYTVVNASTDAGKNLNRCVSPLGTKPNTEVWSLILTIEFKGV